MLEWWVLRKHILDRKDFADQSAHLPASIADIEDIDKVSQIKHLGYEDMIVAKSSVECESYSINAYISDSVVSKSL